MEKFPKYSDEELIRIYKAGNELAVDTLFDRYKNIVKKKAKAMFIVGGDNEDLIQEGMIGLYKAVRDFDESRESSFATFASMCINRQMCTAVAASNRKKHLPLNKYVSLDTPVYESEDNNTKLMDTLYSEKEQNPESLFIDRENMDFIEYKIGRMLSKYEKQVLFLHIEGMDYIQIAQKLGKTSKSVDNALQRIKNKLSTFI